MITLKALRVNQNLKQSEAAARLGVTEDTLRSWENGETYPNVKQVKEIEKLYDTSYDQINFLISNVG